MYWMSATCAGWFARAGSTLSVRSRRPLAIGGDQLAIKKGEAFAQIALVKVDAAQINRGGRDRSMAQQHLHDLERVEIGIGAGLDLKAGQHRHREGVPQAVQCTQKSRSRESFRELRRQEFSRHSPAMLVQPEIGRRAIAPVGTAEDRKST